MAHALRSLLIAVGFATLATAHVGSPDVYYEGNAGPYRLLVTLRPPQVIPGILGVEVRSRTQGVAEIKAVPRPLAESGGRHAPLPDTLQSSRDDSQFFNGNLWLMADGSWEIRMSVSGSRGSGVLSVPVPAIARSTQRMQWELGLALSVIGSFLVAGLVAISGASVREARLGPGTVPGKRDTRNARAAMMIAGGVIVLTLWGGKLWWDNEVAVFQNRVYKPLAMDAQLSGNGILDLRLREPGWMQPDPRRVVRRILFVRKIDDLVPDHNHLMHLYAIRQPGMDVIYHLHPDLVQAGEFRLRLPPMPEGRYNLYADVVHENGLPETLTANLVIPRGGAGDQALSGDDARGEAPPIDSAQTSDVFQLPDGYRMKWIRNRIPPRAGQAVDFRFELMTPDGNPPRDMALYMGMSGHAAFVKKDGTVFAHIHPNGSVPMAAVMRGQGSSDSPTASTPMQHDMPGMDMSLPNVVAFPYGLPTPGSYRVFVQMKHGPTVETGVFDITAH